MKGWHDRWAVENGELGEGCSMGDEGRGEARGCRVGAVSGLVVGLLVVGEIESTGAGVVIGAEVVASRRNGGSGRGRRFGGSGRRGCSMRCGRSCGCGIGRFRRSGAMWGGCGTSFIFMGSGIRRRWGGRRWRRF